MSFKSYTIVDVTQAKNMFAERGWPGEMKFLKNELETEQVAVAYRKMPPQTGAKGGKGHSHKTQEEIFFVISGTIQFKLDEDIVDVKAPGAVRVAPPVVRGVWNNSDSDAELLIISTRSDDLMAETEMVEGFWPAD